MSNQKKSNRSKEKESDWQERVVQIRRVTKVVKGGKKLSFRAILIIGNEKGEVGVLEGSNGFDAILPEAAECRMAGLFKNAELTKNTKMLYVHGEDDDLTLAKPCEEYVKNILAKEGQIEIDIKSGWGHDWHSPYKPQKVLIIET